MQTSGGKTCGLEKSLTNGRRHRIRYCNAIGVDFPQFWSGGGELLWFSVWNDVQIVRIWSN